MTNDTVAPDRPRRSCRWKIGRKVGEVVLIALGVFLGLAGEQWRDRIERRERAQETLRRIRAEIALNEAAVAKGDVVLIEKALADLYRRIGPQIDRALD